MKDLRTLICKINDLSDLTKVLNYFKQCETNCEEHLFTEDVLKSYADPNKKVARRYKTFYIPKKNGKLREISAPNRNLKQILYYLNMMLGEVYQASPSAMGFVKGRSIVDNAKLHIGQNYVLNLDLSDFFTSISQSRVCKRLQLAPFNFNEEVAKIISGLCCKKVVKDQKKGYALPQGAPTSPLLTNAVCDFLDKKLRRLSFSHGVKYSRYADDMTFSSMHNVYQENSDFMKSLFSFIEEERFTVNPEKTRLQKRGERQEVTGLTVNDKVNTAHKYTRELRNILYMWEKYGYKDAYASFYRHYKATKGLVKKGEPVLENVIVGKLDFLKMVKGENDAVYTKLCSRFEALNPSLYDSKKTNEKKVNYIVSYSTAKFERVFNTKVKFIMNSEGELSAVCKMGKKEYSICISSAVKDIVLTEKAKPRKNYRFTVHSLGGFYIALCRSHSVNYWMLLTNEPTRDTHVHPKYNNLPIDQLLQEWEEKGMEAAVEQFLSILEGLSVQRQKQKVEPNLPSLGEKKCKKKKSSNVFKEDLMIEDYMDYMDFQASLIDFEDEETIEYNTAAIKKFLNREKDGKED